MRILTSDDLHGVPYEKAECYGKPHIMAHYTAKDNIRKYSHDDGLCVVCHRNLITNTHHQPERDTFLLMTKWGRFKLKPALFGLCGSGTTGCHGLIEENKLKVEWVWYSDEYADAWWSGYTLSHGFTFHDERLYTQGCWRFSGAYDFEWRGEIW